VGNGGSQAQRHVKGTSKDCDGFVQKSVESTKHRSTCRRVPLVEFLVSIVSEVGSLDDISVVDDLETMFRAHYGRLVRALALVAGSQEAAADAVQEAFVKAHLHWRRVQRYDDPVGWIRRVAINKLRDENRRQGRKERAVERLQTEIRTDAVEWSDGTDAGALLAELPRQQRLAMALFYVEGLSVAEVAETLKLSEGAVRFHLHQGRNRLRGQVLGDTDTTEQRTDKQHGAEQ
jgi:RNA polymerase sigma-70 factor, ECF subfamily